MDDTTSESLLEQARASYRVDDFASAERLYALFLQNDPNHPEALQELLYVKFTLRKFHEAISIAERLMERGRAAPEVYNMYAKSLEAIGGNGIHIIAALSVYQAMVGDEPMSEDRLQRAFKSLSIN